MVARVSPARASVRWCGVSLRLRPNRTPLAIVRFLLWPVLSRLNSRSNSAMAASMVTSDPRRCRCCALSLQPRLCPRGEPRFDQALAVFLVKVGVREGVGAPIEVEFLEQVEPGDGVQVRGGEDGLERS